MSDKARKEEFIKTLLEACSTEKDLMISGAAMHMFIQAVAEIQDKQRRHQLVDAFLQAKGFVVYRSSPMQKAALVQFVKTYCPGKTTLAIGDGANDVNMIQTAHIGIGIFGKEGRQASSFSDFAIAKFKFLRRLLFWHGANFGFNLVNFNVLII